MLNIVIFGPPGAGKGTQSQKLIDKYQLVHISTGDLFRAHIKKETDLGKKVIEYNNNGILVPDSITIDMLKGVLNENKQANGFIFDGYPRTVAQAEALDKFMEENNTSIHAVVQLAVTEEEVRQRLKIRRDAEHRPDDEESKVNRRIEEYFDKTVHVLPYYEKQGKLAKINGIGSIDDIFAKTCEQIDVARGAKA
ncbi:adenylate kinase [Rhodocytophaga rosea]|uniref:Adenylate kinase n=1 Tax=Rhodocytophaga rosea TaxID=2704465 RepID=A0A6C0GPM7_9BACT|nr:adenylate kinase [Rhodocytophaga rosea]QHT70009.1 adenylate kinase [Rhodocytophaga rosea]